MIGQSKRPLYLRALVRAAAVAAILIVGIELLRLAGRATHLDRAEEMMIAIAGGAVYAAMWALTALITANMLKKIDAAAKGEKK